MSTIWTGANSQVFTATARAVDANTCMDTIRSTMPEGVGSFYSPGIGMTVNIERNRSRNRRTGSSVLMGVVIACVVIALEYVVNY